MNENQPDIAAVPWYLTRETYETFRKHAEDPGEFFDLFEEWRDAAMEHERQAALRGVTLFRVTMQFESFSRWAETNGVKNDQAGRSEYAYHRAVGMLRGSD